METNKILEEITIIFREILDNNEILLTMNSTAKDVEEWDSLTHVLLIVAIEKHFKIRFTSIEIQSFLNVGDMCNSIKNKISN